MNPRERVFATLLGQAVDRRPWTAVLALHGARLAGVEVPALYQDPEAFAAGMRAVHQAYAPDILFGPFALPLYAAAWGVGVQFHRSGPPTVQAPSATVEDLLARPDPPVPPFLRRALALVAAAHPEFPVVAVLPTPIDLLALNLGLPAMFDLLLRRSGTAAAALDRLAGHCLALAATAKEDGALVAAFPVSLLARTTLPPALMLRVVLPACLRVWQGCPLPVVLHHGGQPLADNAALLGALPAGVVGLVGDPRDGTAALRQAAGPARLVFHGPAAISLPALGAARTRAAADTLLAAHRDDRRLILSTTGPDVPPEAGVEAVLALGAAVAAEAVHA
jgi:uroporphyrinogen decarboxylase